MPVGALWGSQSWTAGKQIHMGNSTSQARTAGGPCTLYLPMGADRISKGGGPFEHTAGASGLPRCCSLERPLACWWVWQQALWIMDVLGTCWQAHLILIVVALQLVLHVLDHVLEGLCDRVAGGVLHTLSCELPALLHMSWQAGRILARSSALVMLTAHSMLCSSRRLPKLRSTVVSRELIRAESVHTAGRGVKP